MSATPPIIYSVRAGPGPLTAWQRLAALAVAAGCLGVLLTAARLRPSPDGSGTHTELGLQPCQFLLRTGLPCPSCGMTTSFAWFVRGNLAASFYVQPMGMILAAGCGLTFWAALYVGLTGRRVYRLLYALPARYGVVALCLLAVAAWAWKIFIHLRGVDGWR